MTPTPFERLEAIDDALAEMWDWLGDQDPGIVRWPRGTEQEYHRLLGERADVLAEIAAMRESACPPR